MEIDTGASGGAPENSVSDCTPYKTLLDFVHIHIRTYTTSRSDDSQGEVCWLCGRDWLKHICLDWANIKMLSMESSPPALKEFTDRYAEVFQDSLGTMKSFHAHLSLKEGVTPRFHCPRPAPFAIKDSVSRELDCLEEVGILCKIDHSEWPASVVPVPKKDGTICLCGDYKVTINPVLQVDQYPGPSEPNGTNGKP